jgi:hypothetical protein
MNVIVDDSHVIPDYIRNMPREERKQRIAEYAEQLRKERAIRQQSKPTNA